jgi:hypothetical protein
MVQGLTLPTFTSMVRGSNLHSDKVFEGCDGAGDRAFGSHFHVSGFDPGFAKSVFLQDFEVLEGFSTYHSSQMLHLRLSSSQERKGSLGVTQNVLLEHSL